MDELEGKKRLVAHVEPNRRGFVKQLIGTAFVPPLVATFAMDSLTAGESAEPRLANACNVEDAGYVGPNAFQSHVFDSTNATRSNGVIGFLIEINPMEPRSLQAARILVGVLLTPGSTYESGELYINGARSSHCLQTAVLSQVQKCRLYAISMNCCRRWPRVWSKLLSRFSSTAHRSR